MQHKKSKIVIVIIIESQICLNLFQYKSKNEKSGLDYKILFNTNRILLKTLIFSCNEMRQL